LEKNLGCQINLDSGEGRIVSGSIVDDIRYGFTFLSVTFECESNLNITDNPSTYITYFNNDWVAYSVNKQLSNNNYWRYTGRFIPTSAFILIDSPCNDMKTLASKMGLELSENSISFTIDCPLINLYSGEIAMEYRRRSLNEAYYNRDLNKAMFIHFNSKYMLSIDWGHFLKSKSQQLVEFSFMPGTMEISDYVQGVQNYYNHTRIWKPWTQDDTLLRMMNNFITIKSPLPALFGVMYTINFADTDVFNKDSAYLCVRIERQLATEHAQYEITFAEIEHVDESASDV